MRKEHSKGWEKDPVITPITFREIYDAIQTGHDFSQGELHLLRRTIERKLRTGTLRLDVEDLNLKPYDRAY